MEDVVEGVFRFVFRGLSLVAEIVPEFFYWTTRLLAPVVSLGLVSVDAAGGPPGRFNWAGARRGPDGRILLSDVAAVLYGVVFWLAVMIGLAVWSSSSPTSAYAYVSFAITSSEIS